jgi:hypothetical protein
VQALLQDPQGYLGGPGFGSGAYEFAMRMLYRYVNTSLISNDSENESTDNIGLPTYTSPPIQKNQTQSSSTTKKKQGKNKPYIGIDIFEVHCI